MNWFNIGWFLCMLKYISKVLILIVFASCFLFVHCKSFHQWWHTFLAKIYVSSQQRLGLNFQAWKSHLLSTILSLSCLRLHISFSTDNSILIQPHHLFVVFQYSATSHCYFHFVSIYLANCLYCQMLCFFGSFEIYLFQIIWLNSASINTYYCFDHIIHSSLRVNQFWTLSQLSTT